MSSSLKTLSLGGLPFSADAAEGQWVTIRTGPNDTDFVNVLLMDLRTFMTELVNERIDNLDPGGGGAGPSIWPAQRTLTLSGAVSGSVSFDGSSNMPMNTTIADGSLTIAKTSGLQTALDGKLSTTGVAASAAKLSTPRNIILTGAVTGSASFDGTANATITAVIANDSLSIAKVSGLQNLLDAKAGLSGADFTGLLTSRGPALEVWATSTASNSVLNFRSQQGLLQGSLLWDRATDTMQLRRASADGSATEGALTLYDDRVDFNGNTIYHSGNLDLAGVNYLLAPTLTAGNETGLDANTLAVGSKQFLSATGNSNLPTGTATGWYIETLRVNQGATVNLIQNAYGSDSDEIFFRRRLGGAWGSWRRHWHAGNFDPTSKLGINANATSASKWLTARTLTLSGAISGSVSIDGSGDVSLVTTGVANGLTIASVSGLQAALDAKALSARTVVAGNGLTGGGDLTANRTLALGTPGTLSGTTTNAVTTASHTHEINMVYSPADPTVAWDLYPQNVVSTGQINADAPSVAALHMTTAFANGNRVGQIVFDVNGGTGTPNIYYRTHHTSMNGGGWTNFFKVWSEANQFGLGPTQSSAKAALGIPADIMPSRGASVLSGYFSIFPYGASHTGTQNGRMESYVTETSYSTPTWYLYYKDSSAAVSPMELRVNGSVYAGGLKSAVGGGVGISVIRAGNTANAVYEAGTTAGSVYFGQGTAGTFAVGTGTDLTVAANRLFHVDATGAYVKNLPVMSIGTENIGASQNLDNYVSTGIYLQPSTANAGTGTNYPINLAGWLEVMANGAGTYVIQRYTQYSNGISFTRAKYLTNWSSWVLEHNAGNSLGNTNIQTIESASEAAIEFKCTGTNGRTIRVGSNTTPRTGFYDVTNNAWLLRIDGDNSATFASKVEVSDITARNFAYINGGRIYGGATDSYLVGGSATSRWFIRPQGWSTVGQTVFNADGSVTFSNKVNSTALEISGTTDAYVHLAPTGGRAFRCAATTSNSGLYDFTNARWLLNFGAGTNTAATFAGTATATDFILSSDRRLKTNISTMKGKVRLRPVRYQMKEDGKWETGFIAQEVRKTEPTAVIKKSDGFLGVAYDRLIPVISQQVNHVEDNVEKLTKENRQLKQRLAALEKRVERFLKKAA